MKHCNCFIFYQIEEFITAKKNSFKNISHVLVVTTVDKLSFLPPSTVDLNCGSKPPSSKIKSSTGIDKRHKVGRFECGMEVAVIKEDKPLKGTIKFIGKAAGEDEMRFGIELVSSYHICFSITFSAL